MTRISPIYNRANGPAPTGSEARKRNRDACAEAWHRHGLAVIDPEEVIDDYERQTIINVANRQYGKRGSKNEQGTHQSRETQSKEGG